VEPETAPGAKTRETECRTVRRDHEAVHASVDHEHIGTAFGMKVLMNEQGTYMDDSGYGDLPKNSGKDFEIRRDFVHRKSVPPERLPSFGPRPDTGGAPVPRRGKRSGIRHLPAYFIGPGDAEITRAATFRILRPESRCRPMESVGGIHPF
jgi:hypothetical protein